MYSRQAFKHDGKFVFWGGLALEAWGGGPGLVEGLFNALEKNGIEVAYEARGEKLIADDDGVHGVVANVEGKTTDDPVPRRSCWPAAGSRPMPRCAPAISAPAGTSPRCAAPASTPAAASRWRSRSARCRTATGRAATRSAGTTTRPEFGDLAVGDNFQKHSYPFAIMVNADGERFCDEGADFRNYTYAKYGREILNQPHQFAWQIFDQQVVHLQRDEYRIRQVTKVTANTIEELADKMAEYAPVDKARVPQDDRASTTRRSQRDIPYNPTVKDGRTTQGPGDRQDQLGDAAGKAALSRRIARPAASPSPLAACGSTPTGGCSTRRRSRSPGCTRPASWSAGCSTSTIPGGTGLVSGSVFGKIAGTTAGRQVGRNA